MKKIENIILNEISWIINKFAWSVIVKIDTFRLFYTLYELYSILLKYLVDPKTCLM